MTPSVQWNDIDLYHAVRDFTSDPVTFPGEEMRAFIEDLVRDSFSSYPGGFKSQTSSHKGCPQSTLCVFIVNEKNWLNPRFRYTDRGCCCCKAD